MAPNYYSILSKAAQGKDAAARLSLYDDARALVARLKIGPDRTEEDIAAQANALELLFRRLKTTLPQVIARKSAPNSSTGFCRRARIGGGSRPPSSR